MTPAILQCSPPGQRHILKLMGNIVVPGKQIVKISLDKKFQAEYDKHTVRVFTPKPKADDASETTADTSQAP